MFNNFQFIAMKKENIYRITFNEKLGFSHKKRTVSVTSTDIEKAKELVCKEFSVKKILSVKMTADNNVIQPGLF